jgi:Glycosyltransferase family 87
MLLNRQGTHLPGPSSADPPPRTAVGPDEIMLLPSRQWDPWERLAWVIWAIILTVITLRGWFSPSNSVYPIYAQAARNWLTGNDLYLTRGSPYRYSPPVAVMFVPLSFLGDSLGGTAWRLINFVSYLGGLCWFLHAVVLGSGASRSRGILLLLIIPLSIGSLNNAQSNSLILGMLLAALAAVRSQRFCLSSGLIALACLFKVYPIAVGLLLVVHYRMRLLFPLMLCLSMGLAFPFALKESSFVARQYGGWFHHLRTDDRQGLPVDVWYRDLRLLCRVCHVPLGGEAYAGVQLLAAIGIAGICWRTSRSGSGDTNVLVVTLGLASCWMTLFGSATESCTYILLAPSLCLAWLSSWSNRGGPLMYRWMVTASYLLFTFTQAVVWFPGSKAIHALGLHPLAALLFSVPFLLSSLPNHGIRERERACAMYPVSRAA